MQKLLGTPKRDQKMIVIEGVGPYMAEARSFACRTEALANRRIGDDPVLSGTAVLAYPAPSVAIGVGAHI